MNQIVNSQFTAKMRPFKWRKFSRRACAVTVGNSVYNPVCNSAFIDFAPIVPRGTSLKKKLKYPLALLRAI